MRYLFGAALLSLVGASCDPVPREAKDGAPNGDTRTPGEPGKQDSRASQHSLAPSFLRVQDNRFIDPEGRQVILHGMNLVGKSKADGYLSWHRSDDFASIRAWGMNCIRLGIIWDGIEPEPGRYDDAYLDSIAERVEWAAAHGLYVLLDMHQDLYSVLYGDGAPAWATLHENKPHATGAVWSDAYLISPAVQVAFDNFWKNAPAPDGIGVQDHYAAAWQHVAKRFANNATVIGYDLMNEPFPGTPAISDRIALLQSEFGALLAERLRGSIKSPMEIASLWLQPDGRKLITAQLDDIDLYTAFLGAQTEFSQAFERRLLQPMHQRVADAIRQVDRNHILLLEPAYLCNVGVRSGIEPLKAEDGRRDPQQAYTPHAYDIVVDTPSIARASSNRVELIFSRHRDTANRLAMPLLVGEWGALEGADERIIPSARTLQQQMERFRCSDTYWSFDKAVDERPFFAVLKRSIPARIAGTLLQYRNDPETNAFHCRWRESGGVTAPTIVYLTETALRNRAILLDPQGSGFQIRPASDTSDDVYVSIAPIGKPIERSLKVE